MTRRTVIPLILALVLACGLSGCGLNDGPLPFAPGNGSHDLTVTVEMANAVNLVPNSEVKVADVTVGSVREIRFRDWHAELVLGVKQGTVLPANAEARIGQKSLLGAEYVELAPPTGVRAVGRLRSGAVIPLTRSGRYPETEEMFSALSAVLNGGGLEQIGTITREVDTALHGREAVARDLIHQLTLLTGRLDAQRRQIVTAMEGMDRLAATFAAQRQTFTQALEVMPRALQVLVRERPSLMAMLRSLAHFSTSVRGLAQASRADLVTSLDGLVPVLGRLADARKGLTGFLGAVTFPFPTDGLLRSNRGDYLNIFVTVDITLQALKRDWLAGTLPGIFPSGFPTGLPTSLPTALPTGLPTGLPKGLPKGLPTKLPGGRPTGGLLQNPLSGLFGASYAGPGHGHDCAGEGQC